MSDFMNEEVPKHKKRSKKKKPKKADHKHDYWLVEKKQLGMGNLWNYKKVCKICGKVYTELHLDWEKVEKDD